MSLYMENEGTIGQSGLCALILFLLCSIFMKEKILFYNLFGLSQGNFHSCYWIILNLYIKLLIGFIPSKNIYLCPCIWKMKVPLVRVACVHCHVTKFPLLTAFFSLLSLCPFYFSPRRGYCRDLKCCMRL